MGLLTPEQLRFEAWLMEMWLLEFWKTDPYTPLHIEAALHMPTYGAACYFIAMPSEWHWSNSTVSTMTESYLMFRGMKVYCNGRWLRV